MVPSCINYIQIWRQSSHINLQLSWLRFFLPRGHRDFTGFLTKNSMKRKKGEWDYFNTEYQILINSKVEYFDGLKLAIFLSFLAFRCTLFCKLFHEIANQSLYTSHNIADFVHFWFCEKLDEKLAILSTLTFRENTDRLARTTKCEMRKMIGETVCEMPSLYTSRFSHCTNIFSCSRQFDNKWIDG